MAQGAYVTTTGRRLASILVGAVVGGLLNAARVLLTSEAAMRAPAEMGGPAGFAAMSFAQMSLTWLLGIGVIGFPLWRLAERRGRVGGWKSAAVFGAVASFPLYFVSTAVALQIVSFTIDVPLWSRVFSVGSVINGMTFALTGCAVALIMWRVAYRRERATDFADAFD